MGIQQSRSWGPCDGEGHISRERERERERDREREQRRFDGKYDTGKQKAAQGPFEAAEGRARGM